MSGDNRPPVIFLAFANSYKGMAPYLRDLPEEQRRLRKVLAGAHEQGLCEVVERCDVNCQDLFDVFLNPDYRGRIAIFHFAGHANGFQLLLDSSSAYEQVAHAGGLAAFLGQQPGLQLVFLNACSTQDHATALLNANISVVIATACAIDDKVAMEFSALFYQALAAGVSFHIAYFLAVSGIRTKYGKNTRDLYHENAEGGEISPWYIDFKPGAASALEASLPGWVADYLFGLPELPKTSLPEEPYRSLDRFNEEDARVFFGRAKEIRELYKEVTTGANPIILLYGHSGVGKSSLLRAGLFPRLISTHTVHASRRDQKTDLIECVKEAIPEWNGDRSLREVWIEHQARSNNKPPIVCIDQVDAAFSDPARDPAQELAGFLARIVPIFSSTTEPVQGKLILGIRKEWLPEMEKALRAAKLDFSKQFLDRLDRAGVIDAIEGPTRSPDCRARYKLTIESGLAVHIADDLLKDTPSAVAPILQILLRTMWEAARNDNPENPHFNLKRYTEIEEKGVHFDAFLVRQLGILGSGSLSAMVNSGLALDMLEFHTTNAEPATARTRSRKEVERTYRHAVDKLDVFINSCKHLYLMIETPPFPGEEMSSTRLYHDTLAPAVHNLFDKSKLPGQQALGILESRSAEWRGDKKGAPLDEPDLATVERGELGMRGWTPAQKRLVAASRKKYFRRYGWGMLLIILAPFVANFMDPVNTQEWGWVLNPFVPAGGMLFLGTWLLYQRLRNSPGECKGVGLVLLVITVLNCLLAYWESMQEIIPTSFLSSGYYVMTALPLVGLLFILLSHRRSGWARPPYLSYLAVLVAWAMIGWAGYDIAYGMRSAQELAHQILAAFNVEFQNTLTLEVFVEARKVNLIVLKPSILGPSLDDAQKFMKKWESGDRTGQVAYVGFVHPIVAPKISSSQEIDRAIRQSIPAIIERFQSMAHLGHRPVVGVFPVTVDNTRLGETATSENPEAHKLADELTRKLEDALRRNSRGAFVVVDGLERLRKRGLPFPDGPVRDFQSDLLLLDASSVDIGVVSILKPEPVGNIAGSTSVKYGITTTLISPDGAWQHVMVPELPRIPGGGVPIGGLVAGGPADKGGMKLGDTIISMRGKSIGTFDELLENLSRAKPDERVEFVVNRVVETKIQVVLESFSPVAPVHRRKGAMLGIFPRPFLANDPTRLPVAAPGPAIAPGGADVPAPGLPGAPLRGQGP